MRVAWETVCRVGVAASALWGGAAVASTVAGLWVWGAALFVAFVAVFAWVSSRALFWWPRKPADEPVVLMLHSVSEGIAEPTAPNNSIRPAALSRLIGDLRAAGYRFATLRDAFSAPVRRRTVVLTFDDGFVDNFTELLPILRWFNVPATVFATSRRAPAFLSEAQIREMAASGLVEFGGHTVSHVRLAQACDEATATREIAENKRDLEAIVGAPLVSFAYPFGDFGEREERLAREAGYRFAVTTRKHGRVESPFRIPRQIIPRDTPAFAAYLLATRGKRRL